MIKVISGLLMLVLAMLAIKFAVGLIALAAKVAVVGLVVVGGVSLLRKALPG